jgi:hypothetical protein
LYKTRSAGRFPVQFPTGHHPLPLTNSSNRSTDGTLRRTPAAAAWASTSAAAAS